MSLTNQSKLRDRLNSQQVKTDITIDEYVELRRSGGKGRPVRYADYPAPYGVISDAKKFGIDEALLTRVLESRVTSISANRIRHNLGDEELKALDADLSDVCLQLMTAFSTGVQIAKTKRAKTREEGAIPDSLVKELVYHFTGVAVDLARSEAESPLFSLDDVAALVEFTSRSPERKKRLADPLKSDKRRMAAQFIRFDPTVKDRELARCVGVAHTTIQDWRKDPDFCEEVRQLPTSDQFNRAHDEKKDLSHMEKTKFFTDHFYIGKR